MDVVVVVDYVVVVNVVILTCRCCVILYIYTTFTPDVHRQPFALYHRPRKVLASLNSGPRAEPQRGKGQNLWWDSGERAKSQKLYVQIKYAKR